MKPGSAAAQGRTLGGGASDLEGLATVLMEPGYYYQWLGGELTSMPERAGLEETLDGPALDLKAGGRFVRLTQPAEDSPLLRLLDLPDQPGPGHPGAEWLSVLDEFCQEWQKRDSADDPACHFMFQQIHARVKAWRAGMASPDLLELPLPTREYDDAVVLFELRRSDGMQDVLCVRDVRPLRHALRFGLSDDLAGICQADRMERPDLVVNDELLRRRGIRRVWSDEDPGEPSGQGELRVVNERLQWKDQQGLWISRLITDRLLPSGGTPDAGTPWTRG